MFSDQWNTQGHSRVSSQCQRCIRRFFASIFIMYPSRQHVCDKTEPDITRGVVPRVLSFRTPMDSFLNTPCITTRVARRSAGETPESSHQKAWIGAFPRRLALATEGPRAQNCTECADSVHRVFQPATAPLSVGSSICHQEWHTYSNLGSFRPMSRR